AMYPTWQAITDSLFDEIRNRQVKMPYLEVLLNAAHPLLLRRWQTELSAFAPNAVQITGWGLTETSGLIAMTPPSDPDEVRIETVGTAFNGAEICVMDPETRVPLGANEVGELAVRGRQVFAGYWHDTEKTEKSHIEGWFLSGDRGSLT